MNFRKEPKIKKFNNFGYIEGPKIPFNWQPFCFAAQDTILCTFNI